MNPLAVQHRRHRGKFSRAFTLIELLMVIAIIGILSALLLTGIVRSKEAAKASACLSNLRQFGLAVQMYTHDSNNRMPIMYDAPVPGAAAPVPAPPPPTMDVVLRDYLGNLDVLRCPSDDQRLFELTHSSYSWNFLLNGQPADRFTVLGLEFQPHAIWLAFDKDSFHRARGPKKARNYLYGDGHIQNLLAIEGTLPGQ